MPLSTGDTISIVSGLVGVAGVIIAAANFWITRRNNPSIVHLNYPPEPDLELGLLSSRATNRPSIETDEEVGAITTQSNGHEDRVHRIIGEALELFSRHLRT